MDVNVIAAIATVLGLAFALPGVVLSIIHLRDYISQQQKGNDSEQQ